MLPVVVGRTGVDIQGILSYFENISIFGEIFMLGILPSPIEVRAQTLSLS